MTLESSLLSLMQDSVTIEPYTGETGARVPSYGSGVAYAAQVLPWTGRSIVGLDGREFQPQCEVILEGRVAVDPRSRVTLPSDVLIAGTRQPPIRAVQPGPANDLSMDYTRLIF